MSKQYGQRAKDLRAVFDAAPGVEMTPQAIYERMGATGVDQIEERRNIRDTLPWLVRCGFLVKEGRGKLAKFKASGRGMTRVKLTDDDLKERKRQRNARRTPAQGTGRGRSVKVGARGHRAAAAAGAEGASEPGETVEQFLARGGRVQRLVATWEQAA